MNQSTTPVEIASINQGFPRGRGRPDGGLLNSIKMVAQLFRLCYTHDGGSNMKHSNTSVAELKELTGQFGNQAQIAEVLDVDKSTITRWLHGDDIPEQINVERIAGLWYVWVKLNGYYRHPETSINWLLGINGFLRDQQPMELIRQGRVSEVLSAVEQTIAGSYV